LTKTQADAKAKAFKAEQDVNAKRLATAAKAEATLSAATPAVEEEVAEVESTEETPAAEEKQRNSSINLEARCVKKIVST
jgi:small subunit ribosomal protein S16